MSLFFTPGSRTTEATIIKVDQDDDLYSHTGHARRDMLGNTLRRAQELSIDFYRTDPIANRAISIYVSYMAGDGFGIIGENPEVQAVLDEAWYAPRNQLDRHTRGFARDFLLLGELFPTVATDQIGNTTVGIVDPLAVDHIERSPLNNLILETVHLARDARTQDAPPLVVVRANPDPFDDSAGLLQGDCFAWLYDRMVGTTRGIPFLLPVLDWLDGYGQVLWEILERHKAMRAYFWDVTIDGGITQIDQVKKDWGETPPKSGSVRFRTDGITNIEAVAPSLGSSEDVQAARHFLRHIAVGAGVAPHWLGDPEDANRSTAESMDKPVVRSLVDTQHLWQANLRDLAQYIVDQKVAAGMLPRLLPRFDEEGNPGDLEAARDLVRIDVPDITEEDITQSAAALAQVAAAAAALDLLEAVDKNTIRKLVRKLIVGIGLPADELPDPEDAEDDDPVDADRRQAQLQTELEALASRI